MLEFDPHYPKNPQTMGEKLRKTRIDKRMTLKDVAALFGVTDTTILNWEIRGKIPEASKMEMRRDLLKINEFVELSINSSITKLLAILKWKWYIWKKRSKDGEEKAGWGDGFYFSIHSFHRFCLKS